MYDFYFCLIFLYNLLLYFTKTFLFITGAIRNILFYILCPNDIQYYFYAILFWILLGSGEYYFYFLAFLSFFLSPPIFSPPVLTLCFEVVQLSCFLSLTLLGPKPPDYFFFPHFFFFFSQSISEPGNLIRDAIVRFLNEMLCVLRAIELQGWRWWVLFLASFSLGSLPPGSHFENSLFLVLLVIEHLNPLHSLWADVRGAEQACSSGTTHHFLIWLFSTYFIWGAVFIYVVISVFFIFLWLLLCIYNTCIESK